MNLKIHGQFQGHIFPFTNWNIFSILVTIQEKVMFTHFWLKKTDTNLPKIPHADVIFIEIGLLPRTLLWLVPHFCFRFKSWFLVSFSSLHLAVFSVAFQLPDYFLYPFYCSYFCYFFMARIIYNLIITLSSASLGLRKCLMYFFILRKQGSCLKKKLLSALWFFVKCAIYRITWWNNFLCWNCS